MPESTFYYTVDGSHPILSGTVLDPRAPPLLHPVLGEPIVLKVLATAPGSLPSTVTTVTHHKEKPVPQPAPVTPVALAVPLPAPVVVQPATAAPPPVKPEPATAAPPPVELEPTTTAAPAAAVRPGAGNRGRATASGHAADDGDGGDGGDVLASKVQVLVLADLEEAPTPAAAVSPAQTLKRQLPGKLTLEGKTGALVR